MKVLVLEASTTSAKAMLYSEDAGVLAVQTLPYDSSISDVYTHDPDRLFACLMQVGSQVVAGAKVDAIALVGSWHTVMACDNQFHPLSRVITWNSPLARTTAVRVRNNVDLGAALYRTTGCMPHAIYPLYMICSLRDAGLADSKVRFCAEDAYIFHCMTGKWCATVSSASGASLLDIRQLEYGRLPLDVAGITLQQLPSLCDHTYAAPLNRSSAKLLGLPAGTPVCASSPDGAMNQLGCSALSPGNMTLSVGTSAAVRMVSLTANTDNLNGNWCYYGPLAWLHGAATSGAGNCIDWYLHNLIASYSFEEIEQSLTIQKDTPGFLPFLYGERCPGWNDSAKGVFFGLLGKHTVWDMYVSILEGILFQLTQCFQKLCDQQGPPNSVSLSGGILKSRFWTNMLVDILGLPVTLFHAEQASMLGGAAIALHWLGCLPSLDAFRAHGESGTLLMPNTDVTELYQTRYLNWQRWYNALQINSSQMDH